MGDVERERTDEPALLLYDSSEISEDVVELVYTRFDLPYLRFTLCDHRLLKLELLGRHPWTRRNPSAR